MQQLHGFKHGQPHHAAEAAGKMRHKHAANALDTVCAGFIQRFAAGNIGRDFLHAQFFKPHIAALCRLQRLAAERHAHRRPHLVFAPGKAFQQLAGVRRIARFAQNGIVQRHYCIGAQQRLCQGKAALSRQLPCCRVFLPCHPRHIILHRFARQRRFVDFCRQQHGLET